jgi:hypothetical protein
MGREEILKALKFDKIGNRYSHALTGDIEFDFSANSVEGIVKTILNAGYEKGREDLKTAFRDLMS